MGRPEFIPRDVFRAYLTGGALNRLFRVGHMQALSFINREGIPPRIHNGGKRWRPIDVVARARAKLMEIKPPEEYELRKTAQELRAEIAELERHATVLRHRVQIDGAANTITGAGLLTEQEIVAAAKNAGLPHSYAGVYFLVVGDRVEYVGQSVNVYSRVAQHTNFDAWTYIPCRKSALDALESLYIHLLRPPRNGRQVNGELCAPMSLESIAAFCGQRRDGVMGPREAA